MLFLPSRFRRAEMSLSALKNSCSDGTDVAGTQKNFFTTGIILGKSPSTFLAFQYTSGSDDMSTMGRLLYSLMSTMPSARLLPVLLTDALCCSIKARWRSQMDMGGDCEDDCEDDCWGCGGLFATDRAVPNASEITRSSADFAFLLK